MGSSPIAPILLSMSVYWTYVVYSKAVDVYYTGHTDDLDTRLDQHRTGMTRTTSASTDWQYVFYQAKPTRSEAMRLEQQIKNAKSRESIRRYIADPRNQCGR